MDILGIIVNILVILAMISFIVASTLMAITNYREIKLQRHKKEILNNIKITVEEIENKQ